MALQKRKRRWYAIAARPQTTPPPPIDGLIGTTVAAAYSLRRLRSAYAGAAVNIRRSSDNAVQDVGFAGNVFDAASYAGFVGAGTAFAAKWYDQSGNGADSIQATAGNQPTVAPDSGAYGVNTTTATTQLLAAPDAAPIQGAFATGGLLQVVLRCSSGVNVGSIMSKGAWSFYCFPGGGGQQIWFYQKGAGGDGFWGTNEAATTIAKHVVTVAWNASTPATPPMITLDGATCTFGSTTGVSGAATSDVGSPLEIFNNLVTNSNDHALGGTIYEAILLKGIPLPVVAGQMVINAKSFYGIS